MLAIAVGYWIANLLLLGVLVTIPFQDVTRSRVERLALRESLPITVDNGPLVIDYLATTRRWRGCGLLAVPVAAALSALVRDDSRGSVNVAIAFSGWFVGAVIAEWRFAGPVGDGPRRASLERRTVADHLERWLRTSVAGLSSAASALTLSLFIAAIAVRPSVAPQLAGDVVILALSALLIVAVVGRVVRRPRPETARDVRAADDALRHRAVQVLAGSWLAMSAFVALTAVGQARTHHLWFGDGMATGLTMVALVAAGPLAGVAIAVRPRRSTPIRAA